MFTVIVFTSNPTVLHNTIDSPDDEPWVALNM